MSGELPRGSRAMAALDLMLRGEAVRASFQVAYMTNEEAREMAVVFRRLSRACIETHPLSDGDRAFLEEGE